MKLKWDHYSDQPEVIRDKALKKSIYKMTRWASFKLLVTNIIFFPIVLFAYAISKKIKTPQDTKDFFGLSINLDKNPEATKGLINELGVTQLLIRVPLSDIENLSAYIKFAQEFNNKEILINILQDRRHIEDPQLLKNSLISIFEGFAPITQRFQIGNAINRKKWAFFSMDEYLSFYRIAYQLKKTQFPKLILLGSSVIDFEYYFTARTLFNAYKIRYNQFSSLLYVDRRGAPENTQMGLDLPQKIQLLHTMLRLSPKTNTDIVITETNWPIEKTAPYAPTSEKECVSLEAHANFLVRYYLLALSTGVVKNVYWHQLIAPGYGLIDNRDGELIKYPAYEAFKTMIALLQGTTFTAFDKKSGFYKLTFNRGNNKKIEVLWALSPFKITINNKEIILRDGAKSNDKEVQIGESPIYLISDLT